jgi:MFS family permease
MNSENESSPRWYEGITRYQWIVLIIACLGWTFDVFEGQIYAVYKSPAMENLLEVAEDGMLDADEKRSIDWYGNIGLATFLIGGTVGGLFFGVLADRIGRRQTMVWSILMYSVFTGLHYFATAPWHILVLRFFVAMGVAGEWAIAAAFVAEVFPKKARTWAGGIFHASSVFGAVAAAAIGVWIIDKADWRWAFVVGVLPALLVVWVLVSLKESEKWQEDQQRSPEDSTKKSGSLRELLGVAQWRNRALIGMGLAAVGLGSYWAIYAWGVELVGEVLPDNISQDQRFQYGSFAYMLMNSTGGLAGLLLFAPISMWTNRRMAFAFYHVGAIIVVPITYMLPTEYWHTLVLLPVMAFFVVGMHAGYAIYFPELFPTRLRATGASFCFNVGRLVSAVLILVRGWVREWLDLRLAVSVMASLFLVGLILLLIAPETKGKELPE